MSQTTIAPSRPSREPGKLPRKHNPLVYIGIGAFFSIALIKGEVASWYRMQEMFRFDSFHMYGVMGSALLVAIISVWLIRRFNVRTIHGEPIKMVPKEAGRGYSQTIGGVLFGLGWAILGACPGPIYAVLGTGVTVMLVALVSALAGAWVYGFLKPRLVH